MPTLDQTFEFIQFAHAGQKDKAGTDYFLHPAAVWRRLPANAPEYAQHAALLHDIVEDTGYTLDYLRLLGYSEETLAIVDLLTKRPDEEHYMASIRRIIGSGNEWAIRIKHADISENSSRARLDYLPEDDRIRRVLKYSFPKELLEKAIAKFDLATSPSCFSICG